MLGFGYWVEAWVGSVNGGTGSIGVRERMRLNEGRGGKAEGVEVFIEGWKGSKGGGKGGKESVYSCSGKCRSMEDEWFEADD